MVIDTLMLLLWMARLLLWPGRALVIMWVLQVVLVLLVLPGRMLALHWMQLLVLLRVVRLRREGRSVVGSGGRGLGGAPAGIVLIYLTNIYYGYITCSEDAVSTNRVQLYYEKLYFHHDVISMKRAYLI